MSWINNGLVSVSRGTGPYCSLPGRRLRRWPWSRPAGAGPPWAGCSDVRAEAGRGLLCQPREEHSRISQHFTQVERWLGSTPSGRNWICLSHCETPAWQQVTQLVGDAAVISGFRHRSVSERETVSALLPKERAAGLQRGLWAWSRRGAPAPHGPAQVKYM